MKQRAKCSVPSCKREATRVAAGMCEMHYYRVRRNGTIDLRERKEKLIHSHGYVILHDKFHPLADRGGYVYAHRKVLYDANTEMSCFHCGQPETWESCRVDHLDKNKENNKISNLVISCYACSHRLKIHDKMTETMRAKHRKYTHNGRTLCITEWANRLGITHQSIIWRLKHWKNYDDIFTKERGVTGPIKRSRS